MLTRLSRFGVALPRLLSNPPARFVSQSKPAGATGLTAVPELRPVVESDGHAEVSQYAKNPDYHGFSSDPVVDEWTMRVVCFLGISVFLVLGGTFFYYLPDYGMKQWAKREAELLILQREKEGLPLIGENYYDPNKIILPTDGEA